MSDLINQIKYIKKELRISDRIIGCDIDLRLDIDRSNNIGNISTPIIKNILENDFISGKDMNAIVCLFDTLFLSTAIKTNPKKDGIYQLSTGVNKWIKKFKEIKTKSTSGYVYISDILSEEIEVIIKVSKNKSSNSYDDMIREYFIGVTEINKLRYILPNFVYTFGSFLYTEPISSIIKSSTDKSLMTPFIIFEKIPGDNMERMLIENRVTFEQYLGMFAQILIALEIAQRKIGFCHFDFHTANLMCRTIKKECKYIVPIDNYMYDITATDYLPVIIDFGLSSVKSKNKSIGSYDFPKHGMMHYMIQGVDVYKFLAYSCLFSKGEMRQQIVELMSFYGKDDPYKFMEKSAIDIKKTIQKATDKYTVKGSYSKVSPRTPLEFLSWLLTEKRYSNIVSKFVVKKERSLYIPLSFSSTVSEYYNIFKKPNEGRDKTVKTIIEDVKSDNSSYIMGLYSLYVLKGYNQKLNSTELSNDIKKIEYYISTEKDSMIKNVIRMLSSYIDLVIPNIKELIKDSKKILGWNISKKQIKQEIIERFYDNSRFFTDILPYTQFLYTIRELNLNDIYTQFIDNFTSSIQYKTYTENTVLVGRTLRWSETLLEA